MVETAVGPRGSFVVKGAAAAAVAAGGSLASAQTVAKQEQDLLRSDTVQDINDRMYSGRLVVVWRQAMPMLTCSYNHADRFML